MIGVTQQNPDRIHPPVSALALKKGAYTIAGNSVYHNGSKIVGQFMPDLDVLQVGQKVGISIVHRDLHLFINGVDQGAVVHLPQSGPFYAVVDLYGQCTEVSLDENVSPQKQDPIVIPCTEKTDNKKCNNSGSGLSKQSCEYFNLCQRFKASLVLPASFFSNPPDVVCYCGSCCKMRGEELYKKKGDRDFATPQGWVKFSLKATSRPAWHVAYHGTKLTFLRKILDHGQLLPIGKCLSSCIILSQIVLNTHKLEISKYSEMTYFKELECKNGPIAASFVYFRPYLVTISIIQNCKRWCAWDSNPGLQDGRRRRNHGELECYYV